MHWLTMYTDDKVIHLLGVQYQTAKFLLRSPQPPHTTFGMLGFPLLERNKGMSKW